MRQTGRGKIKIQDEAGREEINQRKAGDKEIPDDQGGLRFDKAPSIITAHIILIQPFHAYF